MQHGDEGVGADVGRRRDEDPENEKQGVPPKCSKRDPRDPRCPKSVPNDQRCPKYILIPLEVGEDVSRRDVPESVLVVLVALGEAGHGEAGRLGALLVLVHEAGAQDGQRLL